MAPHLRTLGSWYLHGPSGERLLEPGKPLALLTYLALTPRHRAGREHLIDLLWSESDPGRARQALRQTVWKFGTNDEAASALEQLRGKQADPAEQARQLQTMVDQQISFRSAAERFQKDFPEIVRDPYLAKLAAMRDVELRQAGDTRDYWERYSEIGNELRKRLGGTPSADLKEKQAKKEAAVSETVKPAASRPAATESKPKSPEELRAAALAEMKKCRGQQAA